MHPVVNFTEQYQPAFSRNTLIPISVITDSMALCYSPTATATGKQIEVLCAIVDHLTRLAQVESPKRIAVYGEHSVLLAKLLLNSSLDYFVTAFVESESEYQFAQQYVNSPLFIARTYQSPFAVTSSLIAPYEYGAIVFTDARDCTSFAPTGLPPDFGILTPIVQTDAVLDQFAAYQTCSQFIVTHINTLVTGSRKIFTVYGTPKNEEIASL